MGDSGSTTTANIPKELKPLYRQTADQMMALQNLSPLDDFATTDYTRGTAPLSGTEQYGIGLLPSIMQNPEESSWAFNQLQGVPDIAGEPISMTYDELMNAPTIQAQQEAFRRTAMPTIENQMSLAGLGRSQAAGNSVALAEGQMLAPLMSGELARKERTRDSRVNAILGASGQAAGLGGQSTARTAATQAAAMDAGATERGISQDAFDSIYQDIMRRQGISENALFQPFGSFVPATIGQTTTTSK
jgi:hypothetical protein